MAELTPQETVKAVLEALHRGPADAVVQTLGTPGGNYFCRRWSSGLQELIQKDVNATNDGDSMVTFSVGFTEAPRVILSVNDMQYYDTAWLAASTPRQITTTNFLIVRNPAQNTILVFTAYGRWK